MTAIKRSDEQPRRSEVATSNSCFSRCSKQVMLGLGRPRRAAHGSTTQFILFTLLLGDHSVCLHREYPVPG